MDLSVIIVNYNVKHFIVQCLHSVQEAIKDIKAEIIVVDNNSVDGSCSSIKEKFPFVKLIENNHNEGFAKANNQAIKISGGKYILLLNPDTVVEDDSFIKLIKFADEHPEAGGIGVKMIDGKGKFLPESKRALPTPSVAFYKIFGLSKMFPHSKRFGRYHLGHLDKDQIHEVEILSGAFMFLRKEALNKAGLLDEDFFMYGEDIDLSWRIIKAGYKNYYFPETTIIHYKGESTKKSSVNYVVVFYNAMIIFAKKHFLEKNARIFTFLIRIAIYFRAFLAISRRFIRTILYPLIDALFIFAGFYIIKPLWEQYRFEDQANHYPDEFLFIAVPAYIIVWFISMYFSSAYEKPVKIKDILKGLSTGTIIIVLVYSLLNENLRFSRALIILGYLWSMITLTGYRIILHFTGISDFKINTGRLKNIIIVADKDERERISQLFDQIEVKVNYLGFVNVNENNHNSQILGNLSQLREIVLVNNIDEIIFSSKDIPSGGIINTMHNLSDINVDYKIAPPESFSVIGSNSIETAGDLYVVSNNSISKGLNHRKKRLFDILFSLIILVFSPILIFFQSSKYLFVKNIFRVILGEKSWVGYCDEDESDYESLPVIKPSVLSPADNHNGINLSGRQKHRLNLIYSKDYTVFNDIRVLLSGWKKLDRQNQK